MVRLEGQAFAGTVWLRHSGKARPVSPSQPHLSACPSRGDSGKTSSPSEWSHHCISQSANFILTLRLRRKAADRSVGFKLTILVEASQKYKMEAKEGSAKLMPPLFALSWFVLVAFFSIMRLLFVVLFFTTHVTAADPTSNTTTASSEPVGYVQDPNGRGTPSLLISCVLTLILCVWSALHLNVPSRNHSAVGDAWLNTRWIITGIYAPELVVFAAWRQWCSAKLLQKLVTDTLDNTSPKPSDNSDTSASSKPYEWTMTHSFFACTGGFAFELEGLDAVDSTDKDQEKRQPQRMTLTARGAALLAQCGRLPKVDREDIEDKSKANDLAKATVIMQACWMLVQVIGRLAAKLPVTLLEVNTVAHV